MTLFLLLKVFKLQIACVFSSVTNYHLLAIQSISSGQRADDKASVFHSKATYLHTSNNKVNAADGIRRDN